MNLARKILLVHPDPKVRRRCAMLLAACGFDIRLAASAAAAEDSVRSEWFDLAVVEHDLPDAPDMNLTARLRKVQPTLVIMLLVEQLEYPVVVQGIRQGVRDVISSSEDLAPIVARVCAHFEVVPSLDAGPSFDELRKAEEILECLGGVGEPAGRPAPVHHVPADLIQAAREKTLLEDQLLRVAHERNTLEVQLRTLLAQAAELSRVRADATALRSQREMIAASRATIEENSRALAEERAELARQREAVDQDRRQLDRAGATADDTSAPSASELELLADWRSQLAAQAEHLRVETEKMAQERSQLAAERQSWHKDLDMLRDEEENLRRYESRLRELQAGLEADRLALAAAKQTSPSPSDLQQSAPSDAAARDNWAKFQRATEIFEAEKAHLREDRLALRDWELALKQREENLLSREKRVGEREQAAPAPKSPAPQTSPSSQTPPPAAESGFRALTRAPFEAAKAVLRSRK